MTGTKRLPPYTVRWFESSAGNYPVREWLKNDIPRQACIKIGADLDFIQWKWPVKLPRVGPLPGGVHELRSSHGPVEYRVAFLVTGKTITVLHGFVKKTQQTDANDLKIIETRRNVVLRKQNLK